MLIAQNFQSPSRSFLLAAAFFPPSWHTHELIVHVSTPPPPFPLARSLPLAGHSHMIVPGPWTLSNEVRFFNLLQNRPLTHSTFKKPASGRGRPSPARAPYVNYSAAVRCHIAPAAAPPLPRSLGGWLASVVGLCTRKR